MTTSTDLESTRPGPKRTEGLPVGPEEVRRAVLDAAASLFARRGIDRVSLREIAEEADVHPALIGRYIGNREVLVQEVFGDLSTQLSVAVADRPLSGQGHGPDSVMGKWVRVASAIVVSGGSLTGTATFNPVSAMAETLVDAYGLDPTAARVRAAQIVATGLGWRVFEDYLVESGDLDDVPREVLRDELVHAARRLGATPWPSPPDPTPRQT